MRIGKVKKRVHVPRRIPIRIKKREDAPIPVSIPARTPVSVPRTDYTP